MPAILGVDLGSKRIGLAIASAGVATPLAVLQRSGDDDAAVAATIARHAADHEAATVVVGHPIRMDGTAGPAAEAAQAFAEVLRALGLAVVLWDERLSTAQVDKMLIGSGARRRARRDVVDKLAATVVLQAYLDAHRPPSAPADAPG